MAEKRWQWPPSNPGIEALVEGSLEITGTQSTYRSKNAPGGLLMCHPKYLPTCPQGLPCHGGPTVFIMQKPTKMVKTVLAYALKFPSYKLTDKDLEQRNSVQNYFSLFLWCSIQTKSLL